jgi:hypothetical protein
MTSRDNAHDDTWRHRGRRHSEQQRRGWEGQSSGARESRRCPQHVSIKRRNEGKSNTHNMVCVLDVTVPSRSDTTQK